MDRARVESKDHNIPRDLGSPCVRRDDLRLGTCAIIEDAKTVLLINPSIPDSAINKDASNYWHGGYSTHRLVLSFTSSEIPK